MDPIFKVTTDWHQSRVQKVQDLLPQRAALECNMEGRLLRPAEEGPAKSRRRGRGGKSMAGKGGGDPDGVRQVGRPGL